MLDRAEPELDIVVTERLAVCARPGDHLVRHVHSDRLPGGPHFFRGQQNVDAGAGAEVEHHVAFPDLAEGERVAAPEGVDHRVWREGRQLIGGVARQLRRHTFLHGRGTTSPRRASRIALAHHLAVGVGDDLADIVLLVAHLYLLLRGVSVFGVCLSASSGQHASIASAIDRRYRTSSG